MPIDTQGASGGEITPLPDPNGEPDLEAIAAKHDAALTAARAAQPPYTNTPAAPVAEEEAPDAPAPAPSAPEKPAEAAPEAPPAPAKAPPKSRLAPMLRKERELRELEASIKQREAELDERGYQRAIAEFGRDPKAIMTKAKVDPDQVALRMVAPKPADEPNPLAAKLGELEKTVAELRADREAKVAREEYDEMLGEIKSLIAEDPARWPLTARAGQEGLVITVLQDHLAKTGTVIGDDEAADIVEAHLADLQSKLAPQPQTKGSAAPRSAKAGPRTTTNAAASAAPDRGPKPLPEDDDEAMAIIAERTEIRRREALASQSRKI